MTDVHTKKQRSYNMSRIRGRNTKPELLVKKPLALKGFTYQPKMYGKPDFANFRTKKVVFIDGCFWHGCPVHSQMPKSNRKFWKNKISRNMLRDTEVTKNYQESGWKVKRIWEHKIGSHR